MRSWPKRSYSGEDWRAGNAQRLPHDDHVGPVVELVDRTVDAGEYCDGCGSLVLRQDLRPQEHGIEQAQESHAQHRPERINFKLFQVP